MWVMGTRAQHDLTAATTEQFHRQQLILAEKVSHDIQQHFQFLQTSLLELSRVWNKRALKRTTGQDHDFATFQEILRPSNVLAIGFIPPGGSQVALFNQDGQLSGQPGIEQWDCLRQPGVAVLSKPFTLAEMNGKLSSFEEQSRDRIGGWTAL